MVKNRKYNGLKSTTFAQLPITQHITNYAHIWRICKQQQGWLITREG